VEFVHAAVPDQMVTGGQIVQAFLNAHGDPELAVDGVRIGRHGHDHATGTQPFDDSSSKPDRVIDVLQDVEGQNRVVRFGGLECFEHGVVELHRVLGVASLCLCDQLAAALDDFDRPPGGQQLTGNQAGPVAHLEQPRSGLGRGQDRGDGIGLGQLFDVGVVDLVAQVVLVGEAIEVGLAQAVLHTSSIDRWLPMLMAWGTPPSTTRTPTPTGGTPTPPARPSATGCVLVTASWSSAAQQAG